MTPEFVLLAVTAALGFWAMPTMVYAFGPAMLDPNGRLRRDELARLVFGNPAARRQLEAILHPRDVFAYEGAVGTHTWYDGSPHPYEFKRVWHLEPSLKDPDTVYAGVEDAALFKSTDAGQTWGELPALRQHESAAGWAPGSRSTCSCPRPTPTSSSRSWERSWDSWAPRSCSAFSP